jgi:nitrogen fixation protein
MKSTDDYKGTYKAANGWRLELDQYNKYKEVNGKVVIENLGNPFVLSCK